jgi:hypothetical protein
MTHLISFQNPVSETGYLRLSKKKRWWTRVLKIEQQSPVGKPAYLRLSNAKPRGWNRLLKIEQHKITGFCVAQSYVPWFTHGVFCCSILSTQFHPWGFLLLNLMYPISPRGFVLLNLKYPGSHTGFFVKPRGWTRLLKIEQHKTMWVNQRT